MPLYRGCVTKYGFAEVNADTAEEALEKLAALPENAFDWGEAGGEEIVEEITEDNRM